THRLPFITVTQPGGRPGPDPPRASRSPRRAREQQQTRRGQRDEQRHRCDQANDEHMSDERLLNRGIPKGGEVEARASALLTLPFEADWMQRKRVRALTVARAESSTV